MDAIRIIDEEMWADTKKHLQDFASAKFIQVKENPNGSTIIKDEEGGGQK